MMKVLITIGSILIALSLSAQECKYWKNDVDEFTGDVKKFTKSERVGKGAGGWLSMELRRKNDLKYIYVTYQGDLGCITSSTQLLIKLVNGEVITLKNFAGIDCKTGAPSAFVLSNPDLDLLKTSEIEKFRLTGSEYYSDITPTNANYFIDRIVCID